MEAAERLFLTEGYESVSMRKVAAEIEYSPTTIYLYFRNKQEMMQALTAEGHGELAEIISATIDAEGSDPLMALKLICRDYVKYSLENPNRYELWFRFSRLEFDGDRIFARIGDDRFPVFHSWLALLEECIENGFLKDGTIGRLFSLIWSAMHGFISLSVTYPNHPTLGSDESIDAMVEMLISGLTKDDSTTSITSVEG
ncbi:MAG: TetR/AcrR family transcriptional regulator [bacterium]|nr:TetR/AcrR family transcriptional regulator [bacterium]